MPSCPNCDSVSTFEFYSKTGVPVHSVLLVWSRDEAENFPRGDIRLRACKDCAFIFNDAFDEANMSYSGDYEETQGFSATFNKFHERLANDLIDRFDLHGKHILEIGCGKGEFLTLLCRLGPNTGVGFDPAFRADHVRSSETAGVEFIKDFYSEKYEAHSGDFVCCKMTLEHIPRTLDFMKVVRQAVGGSRDTVLFFQIPETERILSDIGFWDIYYEHCSYLSEASLRVLFERAGFDVSRIWTDYDDQYLMIEARPGESGSREDVGVYVERVLEKVESFRSGIRSRLDGWDRFLGNARARGEKTVLWGGGSKAVAFVSTLEARDSIVGAVDINPYKKGGYLPGSTQRVIAPSELVELRPDHVIIMNPIYDGEIRNSLDELGIEASILHVDDNAVGQGVTL